MVALTLYFLYISILQILLWCSCLSKDTTFASPDNLFLSVNFCNAKQLVNETIKNAKHCNFVPIATKKFKGFHGVNSQKFAGLQQKSKLLMAQTVICIRATTYQKFTALHSTQL